MNNKFIISIQSLSDIFTYNIFLTSSELKKSKMFHLNHQEGQEESFDRFQSLPPLAQRPLNSKGGEYMQEMYYQEYKKIYQTSYKLWTEGKKQIIKQQILEQKLTQIETQMNAFYRKKRTQELEEAMNKGEQSERKRSNKRNRRTAEEIQRKYECPYEYCDRCYGSDGSLQQHLKLKHPELYNKLMSSLQEQPSQ